MSVRVITLVALMALGLSACNKAEEPVPSVATDAGQSAAMAAPTTTFVDASGAMADMQSAALEQDATAALSDAASAAVGMAAEANKH